MNKILVLPILLFCFLTNAQESNPSNNKQPNNVILNNSEDVPFAVIENVPIYKGCDKSKSNAELKNCMSEKIQKHVAKKFNTDIGDSLGLNGIQSILVMFKIDTKGNITDIKARAPHPVLEQEAIRIISLIPPMEKPGYQDGKPVTVPYFLPIKFNVEGSSKITKKQLRKLKRKLKKLN